MKKILLVSLTVITILLCLGACGKKEAPAPEAPACDPDIIGTWSEDYFDSGYTFSEDGTGKELFWNQDFTYTAYDGKLTIVYLEELYADKEFTYSVAENVLTLNKAEQKDPEGNVISEAETFTYTKTQ